MLLQPNQFNNANEEVHIDRHFFPPPDSVSLPLPLAGGLLVGAESPASTKSSALFALSYNRFSSITTEYGKAPGFCRVRRQETAQVESVGGFEEVFTSSHWLARIYRVGN